MNDDDFLGDTKRIIGEAEPGSTFEEVTLPVPEHEDRPLSLRKAFNNYRKIALKVM
jgi:hypothetical protein